MLISTHGTRNWSIIAAGVKGRSGKSCRLRSEAAASIYSLRSPLISSPARRWHNQLNPDVRKEPFSEWEDAVIIQVTTRSLDESSA